jgi:hypothetical protein
MSSISKDEIIPALDKIGLKVQGRTDMQAITFVLNEFSFEIDTIFNTYVRFPTGNRTEVKFNTVDELVSKISKYFKSLEKAKAKKIASTKKINEKENFKLTQFQALCISMPFTEKNNCFFYKSHEVLPRLNDNNEVYFRIIISGTIKDLSPLKLISLYDFIDENLK